MKNRINIIFDVLCTVVLLIATIFMTIFYFGYRIDINLSESLPNKIFISTSNFKSINNGDYVKFVNPKAKYYQNKTFTKKVLGLDGDKIIINKFDNVKNNIQGTVTINGIILNVKYKTKKGTSINILDFKKNIIPENKIFVYGTNIYSYDSRYDEFGLIDKSEVIGVAIPLF